MDESRNNDALRLLLDRKCTKWKGVVESSDYFIIVTDEGWFPIVEEKRSQKKKGISLQLQKNNNDLENFPNNFRKFVFAFKNWSLVLFESFLILIYY